MSKIGKYNTEGYYDPTAFVALKTVHREQADKNPNYRPLVYICSPYAGDVQRNTEQAKKYCRFAIEKNAIPVASHLLYPQILDDSKEDDRNLGVFFGLVLLTRCVECWVFGTDITPGMSREIAKAERRKMKIRYFTEDLCEIGGAEQ